MPAKCGQHHRVRLRVRRAGRPHQELAGGVMHREPGHAGRPSAQERAQRHVLRGDQLRAAQGRRARRRDSRAACRAPPSRARARSSRWPPAPWPGCEAIRSGSATTSEGRTMCAPSTPAGVRWKGVSSAPERVVGIAATGRPGDAADRLGGVDHAPAAERHERHLHEIRQQGGRDLVDEAGRHVHHLRRVLVERRAALGALGGQQRVLAEARLRAADRAPQPLSPLRSGWCVHRLAS